MAWVQIEAQPSEAMAVERARHYGATLKDVNGFTIGNGWYGVALGPYNREDAETALRVYRAEGLIPVDSFITFTDSLGEQFWPEGADTLGSLPQAIAADAVTEMAADVNADPAASVTPAEPQIVADPEIPEETVAEARASEAQLSREERMQLQEMLQWAGFYNSGIDGAFGRGTRASMAEWQAANEFEPTGILTTRQRLFLSGQFNAVLDGLDLRTVIDSAAGIEMKIPVGVVAFDRYESPFAHYLPTGDLPARVLLISQPGDQAMLYGLYDIMQTLEIVPLDGQRSLSENSFSLTGRNNSIVSHTEASLQNGRIKGFTLVWPAGDEERRTRLLTEMRTSFTRLDGALDPVAGSDAEQRIDLVSGLEIRKPKFSRSGFYVDAAGTVVTSAEAVANCSRVTLDGEYDARVVARDDVLGIAILQPEAALAPMEVAALLSGSPKLLSDVAVAGFPYEGILTAPTLTFGKLADLRGLAGEEELKRLELAAMEGDAGGPVFDAGGAVLGMLLPAKAGSQQLPGDVSFAVDAVAIQGMLTAAGIRATSRETTTVLEPEDLTRHAQHMTVLVSCW